MSGMSRVAGSDFEWLAADSHRYILTQPSYNRQLGPLHQDFLWGSEIRDATYTSLSMHTHLEKFNHLSRDKYTLNIWSN